ncbi:aldo/keto reductase [Corynebacterium phoceense]|uniref:aldo/keto reductase n=1 Tax=Corynebacterium phoceense TaxID=1686286 RepID=UPI00211BFE17|nr:aldo/keto reductase [Corynebacterium phoceense]MCQ9340791.1 aldo/keto reductase [Corynebacterium phoceense]
MFGLSSFCYLALVRHGGAVPAVNQRRINPFDQQKEDQKRAAEHGTVLQAWSPLAQCNQDLLSDAALKAIADKYHKTVPQVILRWNIDKGMTAVVKSTHANRLRENISVFAFELTTDKLNVIDALDRNEVNNGGPNHRNPGMLDLLYGFE